MMHLWLGIVALLQFSTTSYQLQSAPSAAVPGAPGTVSRPGTDIHSILQAGLNDYWITGKRGAMCRVQLDPKQESCNAFGDGLITAIDSRGDVIAATGEGGAVFVSSDRGQTWSRRQIPSAYHLLGIAVVSDTRLIAVGDWGTVLRSEDGGQTWIEQPLETKFGPDFMGVPILTRDVSNPVSGESYGKGTEIPPGAAAALSDAGHDFFVRNDVILNDILVLDNGTIYIAAEREKLFASTDGTLRVAGDSVLPSHHSSEHDPSMGRGVEFREVPLRPASATPPEEAGAEEGPTLFFVTGNGKVLWTGGSLGTLLKVELGKSRSPARVEKVTLPIGENAIFDGDAKGSTICLAGSDGLIAFSFDEGRTWDRVRNPAYDALWFRRALVLPDGSCLFAGQKGTVVKVAP